MGNEAIYMTIASAMIAGAVYTYTVSHLFNQFDIEMRKVEDERNEGKNCLDYEIENDNFRKELELNEK